MIVEKQVRNTDWTRLFSRTTEMMRNCRICPRTCGADRLNGERGYCDAGLMPSPSKFFITYGEEECLNPAYMLYFPHCNMRCAYCTNLEFVTGKVRCLEPFQPERLAEAVDHAYSAGKIKVLQVLGGEAMTAIDAVLAVISRLTSGVPVVWNSNFYFSEECFDILDGFVDFYVADLKFGCGECAMELADTPQYLSTVKANLRRAPRNRLLIRHLPLGGHYECCTGPVLEFLASEYPNVPAAFHELIPDAAGCTRSLDATEKAQLERKIADLQLNRWFSKYNHVGAYQPDIDRFSGEIIIRKDGSLMLQDVPEQIRELLAPLIQIKGGDYNGR